MDTRERKAFGLIGTLLILALFAYSAIRGLEAFAQPVTSFELLALAFIIFSGLIIFIAVGRSSSEETQAAEPMVDPVTSPVYYEETTPKDVESKTPMFSCPDCGYENPGDADFCIRCGRDLDVTDDVARY